MDLLLIVAAWFAGSLLMYLLAQRWLTAQQAKNRLYDEPDTTPLVPLVERGPLTRWLALAGFRSENAALSFILLTLLGAVLGGLFCLGLVLSPVTQLLLEGLVVLPGGVGEIFIPLVYVAPWLFLFLLTAAPWLVVRSVRRRRVSQVEEDLPLTLELLATLGEAGLGFDGALQRILSSMPSQRPLAEELRTFQRELLSGQGRITSLRRLSRRVEVLHFTLFLSALIQTEQSGGGIADVLRRQSDDLRGRRREQALAFAMALPVKLLFPLVICFLPGLFVATLGPTFYQFFQYADSIIRTRELLP